MWFYILGIISSVDETPSLVIITHKKNPNTSFVKWNSLFVCFITLKNVLIN